MLLSLDAASRFERPGLACLLRPLLAIVGAAASALATTGPAGAQATGTSEALFKGHCSGCHEPAIERAPSRQQIGQRPPAQIVDALTHGVMATMAKDLSAEQIRALAAYLGTPRLLGTVDKPPFSATPVDVACKGPSRIVAGPSGWSGWGADERNTRFQPHPGLAAADAPRLKLKWSFSYAGPTYGQPTVVGDHLFITSRGGLFYALDARTGCVHWKVENVSSRTAPMVVRSTVSPSGWIVFVADTPQTYSAFDAADGKRLWKSKTLEAHESVRLTGSPAYRDGLLFVPVSSFEETSATRSSYACCSFRGSLVALDARTGAIRWKRYDITEPFRPVRINSEGVQLKGPAGGAIWSPPTIDAKRGLVLVATGNSYTEAPTQGTDAIIAYEMKTGKLRWRTQVQHHDDYIVGCVRLNPATNCPANPGADFDFGGPPIVMTLAKGRDVVLSGRKSGEAYAMDANTGRMLWTTKVGSGSNQGGIEWGMATDGRYVYAPNSDLVLIREEAARAQGKGVMLNQFYHKPETGLTALDPATGKTVWRTVAPEAPCQFHGDRAPDEKCYPAHAAVVTVTPGLVFSGTIDGWLRAYETGRGKEVWAYSTTAQTYDTVNGVTGQPGGSIDSLGPTIAGGMVYVLSGYNGSSNIGGNGTNVLLAFSVDGK